MARLLNLTPRLLPSPNPAARDASWSGWASQSGWAPSVLTRLSAEATAANNEVVVMPASAQPARVGLALPRRQVLGDPISG